MLSRFVLASCVCSVAASLVFAQKFEPPAPPAEAAEAGDRGVGISNDECATPQTVLCDQTVAANTHLASTSPTDPISSCTGLQGSGTVWYRYTTQSTTMIVTVDYPAGDLLPNGSLPDTVLTLYTNGPCGSLTQVACNDNQGGPLPDSLLSSVALGNLTPGTTYLIEVAAKTASTLSPYTLRISGCFTSNDECAGATTLECGVPEIAATAAASTNPSDPFFSCRAAFSCTPGEAPSQGTGSVWFKFVASKTSATITTSQGLPATGNFDSIIAAYSGACGSLVPIACNDDINCPSNLLSRITLSDLIVGNTYYVEVAAWGTSNVGNFGVLLECFTPNDDCATPTPILCGQTVTAYTQAASTAPDDPIFACRFSAASPGVGSLWYRFNAEQNAAVITTGQVPGGPNDTLLHVFEASATCGSLTPIACNDDIDVNSGNFFSRIVLTGLTPGQDYLIELAAWNAASLGAYTLAVECYCDPSITCPPAALSEPELCGEDVNSGGFQMSLGTTPIALGQIHCGAAPVTQASGTDYDIYRFTTDRPTVVHMAVTGTRLLDSGLLYDVNNEPVILNLVPPCDRVTSVAFLDTGTWRAGVAPIELFPSLSGCASANVSYTMAAVIGPGCRGDANGDGQVSFLDITTVLANFGNDYHPFPAIGLGDADSSGVVNFLDITTVLASFGNSCNLTAISPTPPTKPLLEEIGRLFGEAPLTR